jgi:hypothetical protein
MRILQWTTILSSHLDVGNECMKIPFNVLIHAFHLIIGLGMIGHGRVLLGAENGEKFFHVFGHELGVSIMNDLTGESMIAYNLILYYPSESLGVKFQMSCFILEAFVNQLTMVKTTL